MTLSQARASVMATLTHCPVCGSQMFAVEKSDAIEQVSFACTAVFYLPAGGEIGMSQECPRPTYVALAVLEKTAAAMAVRSIGGKAVH